MDTATNLRDIPKIKPEELVSFRLSATEIFHRAEDIRVRAVALDKAKNMAGSEKVQTTIVLKGETDFCAIQTRILRMDLQTIQIEGNYVIPIHTIYGVVIE